MDLDSFTKDDGMTLKIFGSNIRILKIKNLSSEQGLSGYYDPEQKIIGIDEGLTGDDFWHTVMHEACHAMMHRTGVMQSTISRDTQEIICENVATMILENFKLRSK